MNPATTDDYAPDSKPYRRSATNNASASRADSFRRFAEIRRVDIDAHRSHLTWLAIYGGVPAVIATAVGLRLDMELLAATAFGVFGLVVAVALFRSRV
ncbi:MAG: hypothetical protein ACPGVY_15095 [Mycobacterium sp.]